MNGYLAIYKGKQVEILAPSIYQAQVAAAQYFKAKKSYEVHVYLCELEGMEVEQVIT